MTHRSGLFLTLMLVLATSVSGCTPSESTTASPLGEWEPVIPPRFLSTMVTETAARATLTANSEHRVRREPKHVEQTAGPDSGGLLAANLKSAASETVVPRTLATESVVEPEVLESRMPATRQDTRPTPAEFAASTMPYMEIINPRNRERFRNAPTVGDHVYGRLPGGIEVELEGEHHRVLTGCQERETNFAAPNMAALLEDSAQAVADEFPGAKLGICNISREGGGRLRWSKSHASGRDADISFYMSDAAGEPAQPPELTRFGGNLRSLDDEQTYRFDVPRNWAFVRAMLTHPTVQVQWIFVARPLRRALLQHAAKLGEDLDLMIRAEQLLRQPGDSTAHRDHFHVRVYCPPDSRIEGCHDKEPFWPWVGSRDDALALRAAALSEGLRDKHRDIRERVFDRIEARRLYDASPALAEVALIDSSGDLQARAMDLLVEWHQRDAEVSYALEGFIQRPGEDILVDDEAFRSAARADTSSFEGPTKPYEIDATKARRVAHLKRAYILLGRLGAPESAPFLADALRSKRIIDDFGSGTPEALLAADAARHVMSLELVPALIETLGHERGDVRAAAALALTRITNHSLGRSWGHGKPDERVAEGVEMWRKWWAEHRGQSRDALVLQGFADSGFKLDSWQADGTLSKLVSACKGPDHVGYNADRTLSWLTGRRSMLDTTNGIKYARWRDWINGA